MIFACKYIGMPYHSIDFNCWGLVKHFYKTEYGIDLPLIIPEDQNIKSTINAINQSSERENWNKAIYPQCGDVVLLRQSKQPVHVGVWLGNDGGGVLHCLKETGVIFQSLQNLLFMGWKVEGFYRYAKHNHS